MRRTTKATALRRTGGSSAIAESAGPKRNAARTKEKILKAAEVEFSRHGFTGARVEKIANRAKSNMRMLYHYFGSKQDLYLKSLETIYIRVRGNEENLNLKGSDPVEGMSRLVDFTFQHLLSNPEFVRMVMNENLLNGHYLRKSKLVPELTFPLVDAITDLLRRGEAKGVFRKGIDPIHLYITILAVSNIHLSNRYTLSVMFQKNLADPKWLEDRRKHARDVILGYLRPDDGR